MSKVTIEEWKAIATEARTVCEYLRRENVYLTAQLAAANAEIGRLGKLDRMHIPTGMRRQPNVRNFETCAAEADIEDFGD